jgi:antitoxin ParD1/3/4
MNVTLKPPLEDFVRQKVESGDFNSADEVVSEGLRLLQQQEAQWVSEARSKIDEGWAQAKSGQSRSAEEVQQNLTRRKADWRAGQGRG